MVTKKFDVGGDNCTILLVADTQEQLENTIAKGVILRLIALGELKLTPNHYEAELRYDIHQLNKYLNKMNERRNKQ